MVAFLLHGLVPVGTSPRLSAATHDLIACTGFLAVTSPAPDGLHDLPPDALAALALHHNAVLLAYCTDTAVLPMRFGTAFSSINALRHHLDPASAQHQAALQRVTRFQEYTLRLQIVSDPPVQMAQVTSGRDFLARGRAVRDHRLHLTERRRALAQNVLTDLRPITYQIEAVGSPKPERLLDIALLIDKPRRDELVTVAARIAGLTSALGLELTVTGPWPAYSFHPDVELAELCHGA